MRYRIDFPLADLQPNPFPSEPLPRKASDLNISRLSGPIAIASTVPPWLRRTTGFAAGSVALRSQSHAVLSAMPVTNQRLSALIATARIIPPWGAEPRGYLHCFAQALVRAQALFTGLRVLTQVKHGHDDYARNFHGIENAVWVVGHQ